MTLSSPFALAVLFLASTGVGKVSGQDPLADAQAHQNLLRGADHNRELQTALTTCDVGEAQDHEYYIMFKNSNNNWMFLEHGGGVNDQTVRWETQKNNLKPSKDKFKWKFWSSNNANTSYETIRIKDVGDSTGQTLGRANCASDERIQVYNSIASGGQFRFFYTSCPSSSLSSGGYTFSNYAKGYFLLYCPSGVPNRAIVRDGNAFKTHASSTSWTDGTEVMIVRVNDVSKN